MADDPNTDAAGASPDTVSTPGPDQPALAATAPGADAEPGRLPGRDEIDPELIALPRPRTRIGPVLSLSVIVFCVFIMLRLRADLRFSLQEPPPRAFDSAAALLAGGELDDRHVQVRAVPDRALAVHVAASLAEPGSRLTPVQGTNDTLWIMLDGSVWTAGIQYNEVYTGRLRRLADLPFADKLRRHVADQPPMPRFVQAAAVRDALDAGTGAGAVQDPAGDAIAVAADTPVQVYEAAGDLVRILAISGERLATAEAWTEALAANGLVAPGTAPVPNAPATTPSDEAGNDEAGQDAIAAWVFTATVPGGVDAARARLEEARLPATVEPVRVIHDVSWSDLARQGDALAVAGRRVPWQQIEWVALTVPRTVPADGDEVWVLLTEERPETYWYVLPLFVVLGLFGLLFSWALARSLWWDEDEPAPDAMPDAPDEAMPDAPGEATDEDAPEATPRATPKATNEDA